MLGNNLALSDTIAIFVDDTDAEWAHILLEQASASNLAEKLKGAAIVCLETKADNHKLQDFYGVEIALCELKKNPNRLIICYGFCPLELIRKRKPAIDVLLAKPNVLLIRVPLSMSNLEKAIQKAEVEKPSLSAGAQLEVSKAMADYVAREVGDILHRVTLDDPKNPKDGYEKSMIQNAISKAKNFFPALVSMSDDEVIDFLYEAKNQRPVVMKDTRLAGVFCDIEGTLLKGGRVNQKVLQILQKHADEGKEITVWTDGNINELSSILKGNGISYPVKSKFDFAGATAEVVLDDMDEFSFTALTKICAEKFIRIC